MKTLILMAAALLPAMLLAEEPETVSVVPYHSVRSESRASGGCPG